MREGGGDGPEAEEEDAVDDDLLASQPVGERARENSAQREADQRGANHQAQLVVAYPPLQLQRRGDKAHDRDIKPIKSDNAKAEKNNLLLKAAQRITVN